MKKPFLLFVCLVMATVSSYAATAAKCALQHKGQVTLFDNDKIADAITASVDGDTIFLTEGSFPSFTLDKQVTVRGAGQSSIIGGDVTIKINGTPTLKQTILEALYINGRVSLSSAMNEFKIKQCTMSSFQINADNSNIIIDRCKITSRLYESTYIISLTAINSQIYEIYASNGGPNGNVCNFINCNIYQLYNYESQYLKGTFINCCIYTYGRYYSSGSTFGYCTFINSLYNTLPSLDNTCTMQGNYKDTNMTINSSTMNCSYDANTLRSKGFLGNDGTVVGIEGGTTPFTLVPAIPKVTESTISLNAEKKVLNVNLKVSAK